jgi:hypothetical protein
VRGDQATPPASVAWSTKLWSTKLLVDQVVVRTLTSTAETVSLKWGVLHPINEECNTMSKGTRVYTLRIPDDLAVELKSAIESTNQSRHDEPHTMSSYIIYCIRRKLCHRKRSNPGTKPKGAP